LKIPVYTEKQIISISGRNIKVEPGTGTPRYRVGDQLRVVQVDLTAMRSNSGSPELRLPVWSRSVFRFDASLQESFPNRDVFDRALQSTFTEGLKYTDIDDAKRSFVAEQFERSVKEIGRIGVHQP